MSTYDFEVRNNLGQVVVDSNYPSYTIRTSGSFSIGGNLQFSYVDVTFTPINKSNMPQVFFEMPATTVNPLCVLSYLMSGDDVYGVRVHSYDAANAYRTFNYVVAVPVNVIPNPGNETYGVVVYDANGRITFSSAAPLFTIKHVQAVTAGSVVTHEALTGIRYVAVSTVTGFKWDYIGSSQANSAWNGVKAASSTTLQFLWNLYSVVAPTDHSEYHEYTATVLVAELKP